jgi:hypothetical protein
MIWVEFDRLFKTDPANLSPSLPVYLRPDELSLLPLSIKANPLIYRTRG